MRGAASLVIAFALAAGCDNNDVSLGSNLSPHVAAHAGGGTAGTRAGAGTGGGSGGSGATSGTGNGHGSGGMSATTTPGKDAGTGASTDAGMMPAGCSRGTGDCDGRSDNGCETNLDSDIAHCGKCNNACPGLGLMSFGSTCTSGMCVLNCEAPFANCDGDLTNGCEGLGPCP